MPSVKDDVTQSDTLEVQASPANPWLFWSVVVVIVLLDVVTKAMAVYSLTPQHVPHEIVGDWLRFTLVYNPGAAFGLNVGALSRWFFMALSVVALAIMGWMYRMTGEGNYLRTLALAMVCAGAIGNLIDRVRSSAGVVDFIDVGIGLHRWPTFNVADMGVSVGAILLAWVLFQEDRAAARAVPADQR